MKTRFCALALAINSACAFPCLADAAEPLSRLPRTNLLAFHAKAGNISCGNSKAVWRKRRAEVLHGMQAVMGPLPEKDKRHHPLSPETALEEDLGSYLRRTITYSSEPGNRVPAYLLVPKAALEKNKPRHAVLALHPTDMEFGHRVTVEQLRGTYRAYARDLVERGYVVLAPAYPIMANYHPDLQRLGYRSGTMKAIWDNIRGLDYLESLPFVKKGSFGAVGHSLGGHNAIYTAVFEPRISVIVTSCGFDSFLDYYAGNEANWQHGRGWCQDRYMPGLARYRGRLEEIPFDFHELIAALAPRPVFINAPLRDANFQWRSVDEIVQAASQVFQLYGVSENLQAEHPDCAHDFPPEIRGKAYRFMETHLR